MDVVQFPGGENHHSQLAPNSLGGAHRVRGSDEARDLTNKTFEGPSTPRRHDPSSAFQRVPVMWWVEMKREREQKRAKTWGGMCRCNRLTAYLIRVAGLRNLLVGVGPR